MGNHLDDRTLARYAVGLLSPADHAAVAARLAEDAPARARLALFAEGLDGPPHAAADIDRLWTAVDARTGGGPADGDSAPDAPSPADRASAPDRRLLAPRRPRRYLAPLAAAAGLAIVFAAWRFLAPAPAAGWVASADPAVRVEGAGPGGRPVPGTRYAVPAGKRLALVLGDTAALDLEGPARAGLLESVSGEAAGARWRLDEGRLAARVTPGHLRFFVVETPHAVVTVSGTRFSVKVTDEATEVDVQEGRVRVGPTGAVGERVIAPGGRARIGAAGFTAARTNGPATDARATGGPGGKAADPTVRERLRLSDGTVLDGRIVSQTATHVRIRTAYGEFDVERARIQNVEYR